MVGWLHQMFAYARESASSFVIRINAKEKAAYKDAQLYIIFNNTGENVQELDIYMHKKQSTN